MPRTATGLTVSATSAERRMIAEYTELTGATPTRLVRRLVFARLPHIIAALNEAKAAGLDPTAVPEFDFAPMRDSAEQRDSFYRPDESTWAEPE
jgi:hypothetical protein